MIGLIIQIGITTALLVWVGIRIAEALEGIQAALEEEEEEEE